MIPSFEAGSSTQDCTNVLLINAARVHLADVSRKLPTGEPGLAAGCVFQAVLISLQGEVTWRISTA